MPGQSRFGQRRQELDLPSYTFSFASRESDTITVKADRESLAIGLALSQRPFGDDRDRAALVMRRSDLERSVPLRRTTARRDLNDAGYYHR